MISRHFVDVANSDGSLRRVHYRRAGSGPPLLLIHQSPRSSAEYIPLIAQWAADFTILAPDTPGFGDSQPLPHDDPECEDYAAAVIAFLDALGLEQVAAYGFHSGAIILVTAAKHFPDRFSALACGGYAVWTEAEKADFGARYTPPFVPLPYGEHLAWLWGRVQEQSWFFPWYRAEPGSRLSIASDDPQKSQPIVMECLSAGDSFRKGYAAVLRANRDVPLPGQPTPPVLIAAYESDPLHAHLTRMGDLPPNWRLAPVATPADLEAAARDWLLAYPAPLMDPAADAADEGFVPVEAAGYRGALHWKGTRDARRLFLHAPGSALTAAPFDALALDLPGHGLSDRWDGASHSLGDWAAVVAAALSQIGAMPGVIIGDGWADALADAVAARIGADHQATAKPAGTLAQWRQHGLPDLTPDRDGLHLLRAWRMVRAATFFDPWFIASPQTAKPFDPADAAPQQLALRHLALMRAENGHDLLAACLDAAAARDGH